jgi:hypothetical protein
LRQAVIVVLRRVEKKNATDRKDNVPASDESESEDSRCRCVIRSCEKIEREIKKKKKEIGYREKMNRSQTIQTREVVVA